MSVYDLPIFRREHRAASPDGRHEAWMSAVEVSMSNPTIGALHLDDGTLIERCNPSFVWSDDSRYLAVPQYQMRFGVRLRQRLLIVDIAAHVIYASRPLGRYLQPETFASGVLVVTREPFRTAETLRFTVPEDLAQFRVLT